jgi:hypothetical protein
LSKSEGLAMEKLFSMNSLFCFVFPPERLLVAPLYFGGAIMGQGRKMPKGTKH